MENDYILLYSGVPNTERARAGVGFLVKKQDSPNIKQWKFINERIMVVEITEEYTLYTLVIVYGPNESELAAVKDEFFDTLQRTIDEATQENLILIGDFNGRVGNQADLWQGVIGPNGEDHVNNNGERLLELCICNSLAIVNTKFKHKDVHKFTRSEPSRNEKSIIDYAIIKSANMKYVRDCRVKRGPEIGSDHHLVVLEMTTERRGQTKNKERTQNKSRAIKTYKLREKEAQKNYQDKISEKVSLISTESENLEDMWAKWKTIILESAAYVCGISTKGPFRKLTHWWSEEIKTMIHLKKSLWRKYLASRTRTDYEEYKTQRIRVKNAVLVAKSNSWKEFGEKMENAYKDNRKLFYRILKRLRTDKECPLKFIKDRSGNLITSPEGIMERWKQYFEELLADSNNLSSPSSQDPTSNIEPSTYSETEGNITMGEMKAAIAKLKLGKAPGADNITTEMVKYMGPAGEDLLLKVIQLAWIQLKIPKDWELATIIPIHKKGDNRECSNHRGISLLSIPGKIYSRILETRLRDATETGLEESQCGFRRGRSTQDLIFTLRQITEKTIKFDSELHISFIDLEKAFDKVPWNLLWSILEKKNVNRRLVLGIKSFYRSCRNQVRTCGSTSTEFKTTCGVRQGDILSPYLFILLMDDVIKACKQRTKKFNIGYWKLQPVFITEMAFADDLAILAKDATILQFNLNIWNEEMQRRGMTINVNKTKTMVISKNPVKHTINLNNQKVEQVSTFKYLGSVISEDGTIDAEINGRVAAATRCYYSMSRGFINKREVSKRTKVTVFKTVFRPTLTYSSETWTLITKHKSRLQAAEMKYLRRVEDKTRRDRIRNQTIRDSLNVEPLLFFHTRITTPMVWPHDENARPKIPKTSLPIQNRWSKSQRKTKMYMGRQCDGSSERERSILEKCFE
ncbi:hypothetical protein M8J77_015356 [Diaphorina citri]|nr:hypothetical protein M8J77_015356 [Diaphorina citri]